MDNLRGFDDDTDGDGFDDADESDDDALMDARHTFGTDERRLQVRAYNYWAGLLGNRAFPSIDDLDIAHDSDFQDHGVLLDFTSGIENPALQYLGGALADECGGGDIEYVSEVPGGSLLSRVTDHYMQIIANKAPIGFEAEFENADGVTILYRGILLPFSSDDETIDFIFGIVNWKELADQATTDKLLRQVDDAIRTAPKRASPASVWEDAPLAGPDPTSQARGSVELPRPEFGSDPGDIAEDEKSLAGPAVLELDDILDLGDFTEATGDVEALGGELHLSTAPGVPEAQDDAEDAAMPEPDAELSEWLAHARHLAAKAGGLEDRCRRTLYEAIGRAYDFSLIAERHPAELDGILAEANIVPQDRAPMTPIIKLIFGADYDKTRITEYAAVLGHARRQSLAIGALPGFIETYDGGLKGIVRTERKLRSGRDVPAEELRKMYDRLRAVQMVDLDAIDAGEDEFVVVLARRQDTGSLGIVGAVAGDNAITDRVVRKIAGRR